jgi:hypothetical protein
VIATMAEFEKIGRYVLAAILLCAFIYLRLFLWYRRSMYYEERRRRKSGLQVLMKKID